MGIQIGEKPKCSNVSLFPFFVFVVCGLYVIIHCNKENALRLDSSNMSWTFKEACFLVIYKLLYFLFVVHFQVKNLIEKPENDHLPLIEASRLVITFILYLFYPFGSFK